MSLVTSIISKSSRFSILLAAVIFLSLQLCGISQAELESADLPDREGFQIGEYLSEYLKTDTNALLHGAFKTGLQFDTNIYQTKEDTKFDIITTLEPSVGLEVPVSDHLFSVDYDIAVCMFGHYWDQSHVNHCLRGLAELNFTNFKVTVGDDYTNFTERAGSEDVDRLHQQHNDLRAEISAEYDQLAFKAGYTFGIHDYFSQRAIYQTMTYKDKDRYLNTIDFEGSYRFMPKTSFILLEELGWISYDSKKSSDSFFTETMGGFRGDITEDITIDLLAGFRYQGYDSSTLTVSKDFCNVVARGGIGYNITEKDLLNVKIERSVYESTYNDMNFYNVNFVGADYTHLFMDKISAGVFGSYQLNLYPEKSIESGTEATRYDNIFGGGCAVRYDIKKWLVLQAKYEYKQRLSRFSDFDFIDNVVTLEGTIGF